MKKNWFSCIVALLFLLLVIGVGFLMLSTMGSELGLLKLLPEPKLTTARININISPSGSQVFLDNKPQGQTPLQVSTKSGKHTIRVENGGYQVFVVTLEVKAGDDVNLTNQLRFQPTGELVGQDAAYPFWTSDGILHYYHISNGDILTYPEGTLQAVNIPGRLLSFSLSPDGNHAIANVLSDIIPVLKLINLGDGTESIIGYGDCPSTWTAPAEWSTICWDANIQDESSSSKAQLFKGGIDSSSQAINNADFDRFLPAERLEWSSTRNFLSLLTGSTLSIWRVNSSSVDLISVIENVADSAWDPKTDSRLVYLDGQNSLLAINVAAKGTPRILTSAAGAPISWMPDGNTLLYSIYNSEEGGTALWGFDMNSEIIYLLADASIVRGRVGEINISANSQFLAYSTDNHYPYIVTLNPNQ